MTKAFVAGFPIKHSMSPRLHGFWLEHYGIDGTYDPVEIAPEAFAGFLGSMQSDGFVGGNVTLPHKEMAHQLVHMRDAAAENIGAVNTLWLEDDKLVGGNTDAYGFAANLDDVAPTWRGGSRALVLGAGGASRAVIHALLEAGYTRVDIVNRTLSRAENLAERFGEKCYASSWAGIPNLLPSSDLLVNTTSLGMAGHSDTSETPMPDVEVLHRDTIVTDIVYTPLETPILQEAKACGLTTVDGLGMLLHQAVPGFERWFGVTPQVTNELRNHILEALG